GAVAAQEGRGRVAAVLGCLDVQVEEPREGAVDRVDLGEVDRVAQSAEAFDVGVREGERGRGAQRRPRLAVEIHPRGHRSEGRCRRRGGHASILPEFSVRVRESYVAGAKPASSARTAVASWPGAVPEPLGASGTAPVSSASTQPCTWVHAAAASTAGSTSAKRGSVSTAAIRSR